MTYEDFKGVASGLLLGDTQLPKEPAVLKGLVNYALTTVATKAESFHLMTLSTTADVLRLSQGDYLIRKPNIPTLDTDVMDIDEELTFAVARYLASYISREKGGIHVNAADAIIRDYNCKAYEIIDQMELEAASTGLLEACPEVTEWSL